MRGTKYFLVLKGVCNTNCTFCNFYETKGTIDEQVHLEDIKKEIKAIDKSRIKTVSIGITGYEPTVFSYFFEVIEFIHKEGFYITLFTNGVKLADDDFTKKMSQYVNSVNITLYSANDEEHHVLTQNDDSHELKLDAIRKCIKYGVDIRTSILLLKPTLGSLEQIIENIYEFFGCEHFSNSIELIAPHASMGYERNLILIPSYTAIMYEIEKLLKKHSDSFLEKGVTLVMNGVIPMCLINFDFDTRVFHFPTIVASKQKRGGSYEENKENFFPICNTCDYYHGCRGVENNYVKIHGSSEIEEKAFIENRYSLSDIRESLSDLIEMYNETGIWFNYDYLDPAVKEYKKILSLPKSILCYSIQDILISDQKVKKLRFIHETSKDTFMVNLQEDSQGNMSVFISEGKSENTKIYTLIKIILQKKLS